MNNDINFKNLIQNTIIAEKFSKIDVTCKFLSGAFIHFNQQISKKDSGEFFDFNKQELMFFKEKLKEFNDIMNDTISLCEKEIK